MLVFSFFCYANATIPTTCLQASHFSMSNPQPTFPSASAQLMWLLRELVKSGVLGADGVCMTFMKQIAGELSRPGRRRYARTPCSQQPGAEMEP